MSKKTKGQKMSLKDFQTDQSLGDWADDAIALPTAPAAATATPTSTSYAPASSYQAVPVPDVAPFNAYLGNLAFTTTEHDISSFFGDTRSVRLVMDTATMKPKGFGYVEFSTRQQLVDALAMNGENLGGRKVRIDVAEGRKGTDDAKFATNWRSTARPLSPGRSSAFGNRDAPRGENRGDASSFSNWSRDRPVADRREGGAFGDRRETGSGGYGERREGGFSERREGGAFGERREREPRSFAPAPTSTSSAPYPKTGPKPNPFGQAAPRDQAAIDQAIKDRQAQRECEQAAAAPSQSAASSGSWRRQPGQAPATGNKAAFESRKPTPDSKKNVFSALPDA